MNRELAEQRVREQIHIDSALEQQKLEDKKALEVAVSTALEHNREQMRLEQEKKVSSRAFICLTINQMILRSLPCYRAAFICFDGWTFPFLAQ